MPTVADTAFATAVVREEEARKPPHERLFDDPYAKMFRKLGEPAKEATRRSLDLPFFRDGVRLRTRFIDDAVREGFAAGSRQLVILGAGFDARGLRLDEVRERGVRVFEIDAPANLERKQKALEEAGVALPSHVVYVPSALDSSALSSLVPLLEAQAFRAGDGAVFVWEGVIGSIDDDAIDASLRFMAKAGGPKSRVVFTATDGAFTPDRAEDRFRRFGYAACEEVTLEEVSKRYWPDDEPHPNAWVSTVGVARVR